MSLKTAIRRALKPPSTNYLFRKIDPSPYDINFSDPADKARHDRMVVLVERMLELNKQKHSGKLAPSELDRLEREIASTDAEIDDLVYELYGITEKEQKIIEESLRTR